MAQMQLTLPDGNTVAVSEGASFKDAVGEIGAGLLRNAVAVTHDDVHYTLDENVPGAGRLQVITRDSAEGLDTLRHSAAHLLAWAVQELYPGAKFAFGPAIEHGFYYDFDREEPFAEEDLTKIEDKMRELAARKVPIVRKTITAAQGREIFAGQPYKIEQIESLGEASLSAYVMGGFTDLCEGPHVPGTEELKAFKLLNVAGAYWRGDSENQQLQRIHGTAFYKKKDLDAHLAMLEEARRRDHRKLGRELDLFGGMDEAGPGLSFWYPRGDVLREEIIGFWKTLHRRDGYVTVTTPHISQADLWDTSGHMQFYRENMYVFEQDDRTYVVKPMNCPGHILIYKRHKRSYRNLPVRYAELGTVYRAELRGTLHGLMRVRGFTQDDAHIFCTPAQLEDEVCGVLDLTKEILGTFGFDEFKVELSVRDPQNKDKYAGTDEEWEMAENSLVSALAKHGLGYTREEGEAVFYGPKIDIKLIDAIGRKWQATTVQFDFNLPRRFEVVYVDQDGQEKYVYMVHRAIMGSLERFIGILTEHYAGDFPLWLAPEHCRILSVSRDHHAYAQDVAKRLFDKGLRAHADVRDEKIGYKIRDAETMRVPYMLVVGQKEAAADSVAVRVRHGGDLGERTVQDISELMLDEIARKK
ncbi:threonine--tRNA ligase [bacterium]|nr:threonine--tRNA ligase [bacterium]MBU1071876.1 threonine--tRNA ligase [bacterium]MBU1675137.1 threonine--tRNA ligase [bacterium]